MKYIIMCGGPSCDWSVPKQMYIVDGERLVERTIRLLQEEGIKDIAITSSNPDFGQFGVEYIEYNSINNPYYWVDCFYQMNQPVCYLFGDVFYTKEAIHTIVKTQTTGVEFFASAPPFCPEYKKRFAEPFAFKVFNWERFNNCIEQVKQLQDKGRFNRGPIAWELWQVIKGTQLNHIDYTNYTVINDATCDIDSPKEYTKWQTT